MFFRSFYVYVATFLALASATPAYASDTACPNGTMRVLVLPFENDANASSLSAFSLGIAMHAAEALEGDPCVRPINDAAMVLTETQARFMSPKGAMPEDFDAWSFDVIRYAKSLDATHVLTGKFSGQVWAWEVEAVLFQVPEKCVVGDCAFHAESGIAQGSLVQDVLHPNGKAGQLQSAARFYALLSEAVGKAFDVAAITDGGIGVVALAPATTAAVATSQAKGSKEIYAPLLLARAYVRYFHFDLPRKRMFDSQKDWKKRAAMLKAWRKEKSNSALGLATAAVRNDPTFVQAQRFYAFLAQKSVTLKNPVMSARIHYEAALASGSTDFRSLMALGVLEADDGHPDVARGYFSRASKVRPNDAEPLYRLGLANLAFGQTTNAMQAFEKARSVNPARSEIRTELALLYAKARRYSDAAKEYTEIVRRTPNDLESQFACAASLRAAGQTDAAIRVYDDIVRLQNSQPNRLVLLALKFKADLRNDGSAGGAKAELLGGRALRDAILEAEDVAAQMENRRTRYQIAINDAIADLRLNGDQACLDGRGASSAMLAISEGRKHGMLMSRLSAIANQTKDAFRAGEELALTPDERERATTSAEALRAAARDAKEMRAQYARGFLPLYRRHQCATFDGEVTEATFDAVVARNDVRTIEPPKGALRHGAPMFFAPEIDPESARNVSIIVDNTDGTTDYEVSVADPDVAPGEVTWQRVGIVAAGKVDSDLHARTGLYRVCIVPKGAVCAVDALERVAYLHDGWQMKILAAK